MMDNYAGGKEEMDKYSLRGKVFSKIREDILAGNYREKDELKEAAISKALGVSRTPVREALRQLELEGLVSIIPNKGAYVNGITAKDIYDIYKYLYDSLMVTKLNYKYFKRAGNGKLPNTYTDYIKNRSNFLYNTLMDCKTISKEGDRQTEISRIINIIVDNIYIYLDSDEFRYIFNGIPTVSLDYVKQYMFLMLDFFKSYKVDLINTNDIFFFDDSFENKLFMLDRVRMRYRFHRKDILGMEDYPQWRIYTNPKDIWGIYDDVIIQYK